MTRSRLFSEDHPERVHDARQPAAQRKQDVQPEMQAEPDLKEHAERRQDEGEQNADDIQRAFSGGDGFAR